MPLRVNELVDVLLERMQLLNYMSILEIYRLLYRRKFCFLFSARALQNFSLPKALRNEAVSDTHGAQNIVYHTL